MVIHSDSHHHPQTRKQSRHNHEDSLARKLRKQLHTKKWVQDQGGYQYPHEQDLGDFGKHTSDNPPSPPSSQRGGEREVREVIRSGKGGQRGSRLAARAAAINNTPKLRNRIKMSTSDIATQATNKVEGAPNRKNLSAAGMFERPLLSYYLILPFSS